MAITAARVSVTDSATALNTADSDAVSGCSLLVTNRDGTVSVDLGPSDVASGSGYELKAGESASMDLASGEILHAITASGTVTVHVLRTGV